MPAQRIYLDHAATTPVRPEVLDAMLPYFSDVAANASSVHTDGRAAHAALDDARDVCARALNADRKEIVFTSGGSESDGLALIGVARALRERGRHVVASAIEHHAVLHALGALTDEGFEIALLPVDENGLVDPQTFEAALRTDTILASVMYANNETGTLEPIVRLAACAHTHGVLFHTDAVQAAGYLSLDVRALGVDLLSLSAHKLYGPKGVGLLYVRGGVPLRPIVHGGSQEFGRRAGTENVAGIVGLARALELAQRERESSAVSVAVLRDRLERTLIERIPGLRVNGGGAPRLPNYLSIAVPGARAEELLMRLDLEGLSVSTGSACTSGSIEPSHVMAALGLPAEGCAVLRLTLGRTTTAEEITRAGDLLARAAAELRAARAPA